MSESTVDTSRVVVQAYIPAYQREAWDEHADVLGMTRSEFVRTMVQAGRRGFGGDPLDPPTPEADEPASKSAPDLSLTPSDQSEDQTTPVTSVETDDDPLEQRVIESLREADVLSWDELLDAVTDDIESELESTMQRLQAGNRVHYSGRRDGYVLIPGDDS